MDVQPPAPPAAPPPVGPPSALPSATLPLIAIESTTPKPQAKAASERRPPFSPLVLATSAGLDLAVTIVAIVLDSQAMRLRGDLIGAEGSSGISPSDHQRFDTERTWAYAAIGGAAALGAVTAALGSWYVFGSSKHESLIQPGVGLERGGASASALAHF